MRGLYRNENGAMEELHEVSRKLTARLKLLHRAENMVGTANFEEKERVCFVRNGKRVFGTVVRVNPQSLTIKVDDGTSWRESGFAHEGPSLRSGAKCGAILA